MMFVAYFFAFVTAVWISIGLVFGAFVWLVIWADGRLNPWMEKL